ncbi:sulfotransferase [Parahaliea maris]|uniref:Sulfotransferase n=1 Tax=Parahaliea maris TaxID=2716870 RepID=A0A5C8ZQH0_9GAMM|nr:sulfotransferase [Parahaliea maris]TXS89900.1 sulfotransferase [Parahaliea maris]
MTASNIEVPPPITFITGYPRSGTTLLANQLNRLHSVVVGPESQYFRSAYKRLKKARSGRQFLAVLLEDSRLRDFGLSDEEMLEAVRSSGFDRDRFLHGFLAMHAASAGLASPARLLEKSPGHILYTRQILACYPEASFIYLVKDPRDVVNSNLKVDWIHSNVAKHCAAWNMYNDAFIRLHRQFPGRVHLLRFEDLVTEQHLQLRKLCQFLDIPYRLDEDKQSTAVPDWEAEWKAEAAGDIDPGKAYLWQREEDTRQHKLVSAMTRHYRDLFGYDRVPEGVSPRFLPRAWAYNSPAYKSLLRFRRVYL